MVPSSTLPIDTRIIASHLIQHTQDKISVLSSSGTSDLDLAPTVTDQLRAMTTGDISKANPLLSPTSEPLITRSRTPPGASDMSRFTHHQIHSSTLSTPTYHTYSKHKLSEWSLSPSKPVLIIGDSNLNRIPAHAFTDIQIDSYPGATTYHLWKLLEKKAPTTQTQKVIISIGINNKDLDPKNTTNKQLLTIHRMAKKTFPNALIRFALLNFSPYLTPLQIQNLTQINTFITTHFNHLNHIPSQDFLRHPDLIHWTTTTADNIFKYWCKQLDLIPP